MKKWLRFFCLGFFSDKASRDGAKRGYTNFLLGLILAFAFLWAGFVGGDILPLGVRYNNSPDFMATAHSVFSNSDSDKRIVAEVIDGVLLMKKQGGEYAEALLINTFENEIDRQNYSQNGYNVVLDSRPADTPAEVEVYCVSSEDPNFVISYEDYLSLSEVKRINFDFKLKYTGRELELNDDLVLVYKDYLIESGSESETAIQKLTADLEGEVITREKYNRSVYELYFESYYPEISEYESTSKIPLLRNYYYHQYISHGIQNYIFIFDDYITASFETKGGIDVSFYGFYSDLENGAVVTEGENLTEANASVDDFMKKTIKSILPLTMYAYAVNIFTLIPFIALMPLVVTLLAYSILKLLGIESIKSFGALFKILGSYVWASGLVSALLTVIIAFFVKQGILTALPLVFFFVTLTVRSIIFAVNEAKIYKKQFEQQETQLTEA